MSRIKKNTACIILAAGLGTRMKSSLPKVLHKISGKTMIEYLLDLIKPFGFKPSIVVTGYKGEEVAKFVKGATLINQTKMLGSADAVIRTEAVLGKFGGDIVILYSDTPLIKEDTIAHLMVRHKETDAVCTLLSAKLKNPTGYGRILRDDEDKIVRIVEEDEASLYDKVIDEINVGAYCFKAKDLFETLKEVKPNNRKNEYYLTDVIAVLRKRGLKVESLTTDNEEEAMGINSKEELAKAERTICDRAIKKLLAKGVTIIDPFNTYISIDCKIEKDTVIKPYTVIEGDVKIGSNCVIGPFATIRGGTNLSNNVEIGNFVELTRSTVGRNTRIKHHSYIGDSIIGKDVNIGAGTITANYDGKNKNKTIIKDGAFIGSGTIFVAPITIGKRAITGAGSVLTKNTKVPDDSLLVGIPARILRKKKFSKKRGA